MQLMRRNTTRPSDPFGFSRDFWGWDPFRTVARTTKSEEGITARFDVKETEDAYVLSGDLPGIDKDKLELSLDGDVLTVSGSRDAEEKQEGESYYIYERKFGSFKRSFRLPEHADATSISADLKDGVLTVSIPKVPETKPRKIEVK